MKDKQYIYTSLILLLLTGSAYFFADTVDILVDRVLAASTKPPEVIRNDHLKLGSIHELAHYASVLDRGLFGDGAAPQPAPASGPPVVYTLVGTVEGESFSGAVLATGKDQTFYRSNKKMPDGSTIIKVTHNKVTLKRSDGSIVEIETEEGAKIVPIIRTASSPGVRRISGSNFVVDQREVLASTENMNQILMQARALPYMEQGKVTGFQISEIVPGSIFAKIGLQNGDIIQQVNSQSLNDPGKFFQLYQGLREERNISIDLLRGGQRLTMNYDIR